jgi:hypothetical protein
LAFGMGSILSRKEPPINPGRFSSVVSREWETLAEAMPPTQ